MFVCIFQTKLNNIFKLALYAFNYKSYTQQYFLQCGLKAKLFNSSQFFVPVQKLIILKRVNILFEFS